ncbi:MAG: SWIM zinc finger family protein, partial [Sciscionella sp.]
MTIPSYEQILALAPDESSAKAGRDLATARKWVTLGFNEAAVWGECQGSGAKPYQTQIDLADNSFKCSCPSRKFPCKHGLGLFLLLSKEENAFTQKDQPHWVAERMEQRQAKQEKKAQKQAEKTSAPPDPIAQAKRLNERHAKVQSGLSDLDRFLQDLVRQGIAQVQMESYAFWENQAKRLVDAQAPGLARLIKQCAGTPSLGEGWQEKLLRQMGRIYLLAQAYNRIDELPETMQADVRTALGFTSSQDELLTQEGITDRWLVVAQTVEQEERLRMQRTWLVGKESGRHAVVFSFAHGTAPLDTSLLAGMEIEAELVFFPSAFPLRALLKSKKEPAVPLSGFHGCATIEDALDQYARALAAIPWAERVPLALTNVVPLRQDDGSFAFRDERGALAPLAVSASGSSYGTGST